jgi:membrane-associated protease RseP (regulator of RpoE activity)
MRLRTSVLVLAVAACVSAGATLGDSVPAKRGWLGVYTENLSQPMLVALDIDHGVLVGDVAEASPAAKAGIATGDVILGLDGENVHDAADLRFLVRDRPGKSVDLLLRHKGKEGHVTAMLEARDLPSEAMLDLDWPGLSSEALREAGKALRETGPKAKVMIEEARGPALDSLRRQLDELRRQIDDLRDRLKRQNKGS